MKPLRVLVLERSPERREALVALLRSAALQADVAPDPPSAAEALGATPFDLLLLDLSSPELDLPALRRSLFPATSAEPDSLEDAERRHLALALRHTGGNKRRAAHLLGISRSTLLNKVRKYGLALMGILVSMTDAPLLAQGGSPIPDGQVVAGSLSFDAHATVGDFVGTTTSVTGQMSGGPDITSVRGWVEAPVRTFETGDGRRDKDLNQSMESNKYPNIRFQLTGVTPMGGTADSMQVTLHGALAIHGVTRSVHLPGSVVLSGPQARVRTDFPLNVKDYGIGGLSRLLGLLKMDEKIEVHVDLLFGLDPPRRQ
ncbi:MAG: YceI family protein [Gemmatimonadales bacterium]